MRALLAAVLLALWLPVAAAEPARGGDAAVKAAVMYNLLLFVQWPENAATTPFQLCLTSDSELAAGLRAKERATVSGRPLQFRTLNPTLDGAEACQAVVVETGNPGLLARLAVLARSRPLLVLGEGAGTIERGAMIAVYSDGGRAVFDINLAQMRRSQLVASAKILRLARQVVE